VDFAVLLPEHHIHAVVVLRSLWKGTSFLHVAVHGLKYFVMWSCAEFLFASIPPQQPTVSIAEGISEIYVAIIFHRL
jgi:hypothetical protein